MWTYITLAATAWFIGFFPFLEIYVAIPVAMAAGLDPVSTVVWCVLGNFMPVPLIIFFHTQLLRIRRVGPWLQRLAEGRARRVLNRYGGYILLIGTPWIGIWAVAAAAQAMGMHRGKLLLYSFISVAAYGIVLVVMISFGVDWWQSET